MILNTEGIVLHSIKYSDTSLICKIYTEQLGLVSYIIKGVRSSKGKASMFNPPNILDLVVYNKSNKNLQIIKEYKNAYIYTALPFDIQKTSIALFLLELLNKCIIEEEANSLKFAFVKQSLIYIDQMEDGIAIFPAWFMIHFASFLGFEPGSNLHASKYFDMQHGVYVDELPSHSYFMDERSSELLSQLAEMEVEGISGISHKRMERKIFISHLMNYYRYHIDGFGNLKSFEVLESVLHS